LDLARQVRGRLLNQLVEEELYPERKVPERIRLDDFAEQYLRDYLKVKAAKSYRAEALRVKMLQRMLGNPYLDEITTGHIERLLADLRRKGDRPATLNRYRTRLHNMMKKAVAWGYLKDNPASGVERLREEKLGDRYLLPHEFKALLSACDPRLRTLVHLAAMTGMRQGELLTLDWQDVDLELGYITVRAGHSKTSEGRRIPLNGEAQGVLQDLNPKPAGRIFDFPRFPRHLWVKAVERLGWDVTEVPRLAGWRFHDLRHCCASWLVQHDVPLTKVAKILGHKELQTTQRYAHLGDSTLVDAMDRIQFDPELKCKYDAKEVAPDRASL